MPWTYYSDDRGRRWRINQLGMWLLVRHHVYNSALCRKSQIKRVPQAFGPDEVSVEFDFEGSAAERDRQSAPLYAQLEQQSIQNGSQTLARLTELRQGTERAVEHMRQKQHNASVEMSRNIDQSVRRGEIGVTVAKDALAFSSTTLIIGSSLITGGAAVALLGGGSVLKGAGKLGETGNVGSAILTATGSFVVGALPLTLGEVKIGGSIMQRYGGEVVKYGQRAVLVVVGAGMDANFQACNALLEGKSGKEAIKAAAYRFGVDIMTGGIGAKLDKWGMPVIVRLITDTHLASAGDSLVDKLSESEKEKGEGEKRRSSGVYRGRLVPAWSLSGRKYADSDQAGNLRRQRSSQHGHLQSRRLGPADRTAAGLGDLRNYWRSACARPTPRLRCNRSRL